MSSITHTSPSLAQRRPTNAWLAGLLEMPARFRQHALVRRQRTAFARALDGAAPPMRDELLAISERLEIMGE